MKKLFSLLMLVVVFTSGAAYGQDPFATTIYDLNNGLVPLDTLVLLEDVVITGVVAYGLYVQEQASGEYSGIFIYTGSANPPAEEVGNICDIIGPYEEYQGLAELNLPMSTSSSITVTDPDGTVPDPILVRAVQVKTTNPDEAEKWESVLIYAENLNPLADDPGYGAYFAMEFDFAINDTLRLDDAFDHSQPNPGQLLDSVTGCVRYSYNEFNVNPRGNEDFVYNGAAPAPNLEWAVATGANTVRIRFDRDVEQTSAELVTNYMLGGGLTVTAAAIDTENAQIVNLTLGADMTVETLVSMIVFNVRNEDGVPMAPQNVDFWGNINSIVFASTPDAGADSSAIAQSYVTVTGIVHSKFDGYGKSHIYLGDLSGPGDYSGLEIYMNASLDLVNVGDIVVIGDYIYEYFAMTCMAEPFFYFDILSSGNPVPDPQVMVIDGGDYEVVEGSLVEVQEVVVVERGGDYNFYDWNVSQDGLNWLKIDSVNHYSGGYDDFYTYVEGLGDTLNICGVIRYAFGEYILQPRSDDDIDIIYQNPVGVEVTPGAYAVLGQNFPNPFNPKTEISFALASDGLASLEIFDVQGRLVKTLVSGKLGAGSHTVTWNGDTNQGDMSTSGMYFYRLNTSHETLTRRMLLLK
ncbi:MAG: T9SS type A sorting domain-containing protein [bacterium]|nr:T9SS type A sorting domain-containing protein [bacterium]